MSYYNIIFIFILIVYFYCTCMEDFSIFYHTKKFFINFIVSKEMITVIDSKNHKAIDQHENLTFIVG